MSDNNGVKYFVSFFQLYKYPFASEWSPDNAIIDIHPLEWAKLEEAKRRIKVISWQKVDQDELTQPKDADWHLEPDELAF